jgi:hypothetical protein
VVYYYEKTPSSWFKEPAKEIRGHLQKAGYETVLVRGD